MDLHYKVFGTGPSVLIIHGLFGMLDNWQTFARKLAENYTVYIIDLRNHGKSGHSDEFSYELISEDLDKFCDKHQVLDFILIGHSLGGKAALHHSIYGNHTPLKVIVIDIAPKLYPPGHFDIFDALMSLDLNNYKSRSELDRELSSSITDLPVRLFLLKNIHRGEKGFSWKMNLYSLFNNYKNIIMEIEIKEIVEVRTLFVKGRQSNYISREDEVYIKKKFSNSNIKYIDAGHWIHVEKPEELYSIVKDFLFEE